GLRHLIAAAGGAGDRLAVVAVRVATEPLVAVRRRRVRPPAGIGGERGSFRRRAADRRLCGVLRRCERGGRAAADSAGEDDGNHDGQAGEHAELHEISPPLLRSHWAWAPLSPETTDATPGS